jgi:hypothetical protein
MFYLRGLYKILQLTLLDFQSLLVTWCTTNSLTFNNSKLCPHCIYVFCIYLRTNSYLCHLQHKLIGFYNRDKKCLQRGTNWGFKYSSLRFVFKGLMHMKIRKIETEILWLLRRLRWFCYNPKTARHTWMSVLYKFWGYFIKHLSFYDIVESEDSAEHFRSRCSCSIIEHSDKSWNNVWSYCNSVHPYLWNSAYPGHFLLSHMQGNTSNSY